jgi:flagella synthesis protein FlgN
MTASSHATEILSRLNTEQAALQAFVELLKTEQQALIDGQVEELLSLSDQKTRSAQTLSQLSNARKAAFAATDAKIESRQDVAAWLEKNLPEGLAAWQDIQSLAEEMRKINTNNGTLINSRMRFNQQALIVLNNAATSVGTLYGRDGQQQLPAFNRNLGRV